MAVYTEVDKVELEALLEDFSIGDLQSYQGISAGVENTNYRLETTSGSYILTLFESRVKADDLPFFMTLKEGLAQKGLPVPRPIAANDDNILHEVKGKKAAIFSFLEGHEVSEIGVSECAQIGKILGEMHQATDAAPLYRENSMSRRNWSKLLQNCPDTANVDFDGARTFLEKECQELSIFWPKTLPEGIIHADLFPDNVLFEHGEIRGVLDFYFACKDFLAFDLAIAVTAWCFNADNKFDNEKAQALIDSYQSIRALSENEKKALPILLRGAATRFSVTRLVDYYKESAVAGHKHDPEEFLQRVKFYKNNMLKLTL